MALDFVVRADCPVHKQYQPHEVAQASLCRDLLGYFQANEAQLLSDFHLNRLDDAPVSMGFKHPTRFPVNKLIDVRWLFEQADAIGKTCCPDCPCNYRGRTLGCYGAVNYPLTARFEQWLAASYNPSPRYPDIVLGCVNQYEITGEELDAERGDAEEVPLFEAAEPTILKTGNPERTITSTQFFAVLAGSDHLPFELAFYLLLSFNAISAEEAVMAELIEIIKTGQGGNEEGQTTLRTSLFTAMQSKGGVVTSVSCVDGPLPMLNERNGPRFKELMGQVTLNLKGEEGDDRPILGFKNLLVASYCSLLTLSKVYMDS